MPPTKGSLGTGPPRPVNPSGEGRYASQDYSYYETVIQLEKSMAQMVEKVGNLAETVRDSSTRFEHFSEQVRDKLENQGKDVHAAKAVFGVVGTIITVAIAILGYIAIPLLFKIVDLGIDILKKPH